MSEDAPTIAPGPIRPLRVEMAAVASAIAVVPLLAVGLSTIDANRRELERLARESQIAVLDDVARALDAQLVASEDALETVGRALVDVELDEETRLALALALVAGHSSLDHAAIYDQGGRLVDVLREAAAGSVELPASLEPEFREQAAVRGSWVASRPEAGRVLLVVPLRTEVGVTGYAAAALPLASLQEQVERLASERFPSVGSSLLVVGPDRVAVVHPDPERVGDPGAVRELLGDAIVPEASTTSQRLVGADGLERIVTTRALVGPRWVAVAQEPAEIVFASLEPVRWTVGMAVALAIAAAIAAATWIAGRVTRPVAGLAALSRDLASRRFGRTVEVEARNELALLATALNGASQELAQSEERIRREEAIRHDLGRYLPAEIVGRIARREQDMALGGARRNITVLFADVVGFTPLTERLAPEETVAVLNELFTILTEIVFRHQGTIDKFVGDAVMALFGAPADDPDHARHALDAAEDMVRWLETGNARWRERYGITIQLALGVHSGECIVGNLGSERRMDYTAIGDVVNVAARLESIARPQQILVTAQTHDAAGEGFEYADLGERELVGRKAPVRLYEVRT